MLKTTCRTATAHGNHAAAKEYAANAFNITGVGMNYLHVSSQMMLKKPMTAL